MLNNIMLNSSDQETWNIWVDHFFKKNNPLPIPKIYKTTLKTVLDLHGMTLQQAFCAVNQFILNHSITGSKKITIITGKSGPILKEFPSWISQNNYVRSINPVVDKKNQIGSFQVILKI